MALIGEPIGIGWFLCGTYWCTCVVLTASLNKWQHVGGTEWEVGQVSNPFGLHDHDHHDEDDSLDVDDYHIHNITKVLPEGFRYLPLQVFLGDRQLRFPLQQTWIFIVIDFHNHHNHNHHHHHHYHNLDTD